jgi:Kef-type K+ transport system membrane component KefB
MLGNTKVESIPTTTADLKQKATYYIAIVVGLSFLLWFILQQGKTLEQGKYSDLQGKIITGTGEMINNAVHPAVGMGLADALSSWTEQMKTPLSLFLLQLMVVLVFVRICSSLAQRVRQPAVIGEIIAGIVLGPSVVGLLFPEVNAFLFPVESLDKLQFVSQVGLILFMFIIGMELDLSVLKSRVNSAVVISHAGIFFPFILGVGSAYLLYEQYTQDNVSFLSFALFMGTAMSITAFPVLSRVIREKGLSKTPEGTLALTCAATDDVTAWCILAVVIAIVKSGTVTQALITILLSVVFVTFLLKLVKPALRQLANRFSGPVERMDKSVMGVTFLFLLFTAYACEVIGIHALFGAFLAGVVVPDVANFKEKLAGKIEDVSLVLFLPLFFVLTGLRTEIALLRSPQLWLLCGFIVLLAVVGKFAGTALTARFMGQSWRDSLVIGALMNARGLMELVVLNIGYDLGILSPEIFTVMVLMALVTTFMTGPALDYIYAAFKPSAGVAATRRTAA